MCVARFRPRHPEAELDAYRIACDCRKPRPGMLLRARDEFDIDMWRSIMVGDNRSDDEAACAAGVGSVFWLADRIEESSLVQGCTAV